MSDTFEDKIGLSPRKNLCCPKSSCGRLAASLSQVKLHPQLELCRLVTCEACYHQWYICVQCPCGTGGPMVKSLLKRHEKSAVHQRNSVVTTEVHYTAYFETFPDVKNVNEDRPEKAQLSQQLLSTSNECTSRPSTFNFKSSRSSNYFRNHAHTSNCPSYLVSNAIFGSVHDTGRIDHREVAYHILITLFLLSLTTNQQEMFASIMEFVIALTEKAVHQRLLKMPGPLHQTSPPSSMKDFRNRYLRDPQSIVSNLACPEIQFIHGHGYVSVCDCISNLLAHGCPINAFFSGMKIPSEDMLVGTSVSTTAGCFMLRKMLYWAQEKYPNENVLCLPLYGWGDDYDPSASIKGGRAFCHCKSIAISPQHGKHNTLDNTFILALS
jgi:hypothetical protein